MVMFNPAKASQGTAFEFELERYTALVADMLQIRSGTPPERFADEAPILDHWVTAQRPAMCLTGLSTGHPLLPGDGRPIVTSDLCLVSEDHQWARTLSRWYRLGRPAGTPYSDS